MGPGLLAAVRAVKPTVLIGGPASGGARFSREVLAELSSYTTGKATNNPRCRPIVLALSNDSAGGRGEVSASDAYEWTGGAALFADRSRPGSSEAARRAEPSFSRTGPRGPPRGCTPPTSTLVWATARWPPAPPGSATRPCSAAAEAISDAVTDAELAAGALLPPSGRPQGRRGARRVRGGEEALRAGGRDGASQAPRPGRAPEEERVRAVVQEVPLI